MTNFSLRPTIGLASGMTIQFAEGRWSGRDEEKIGPGVELDDDAFGYVLPLILATCPGWTPMHRYGVYELSPMACSALVRALRSEATRLHERTAASSRKGDMFLELADWLDTRRDAGNPLSILGL